MIIRSKFDTICYRCGLPILTGAMIEWKRGYSTVRHAACQTERERAIAPYDHDTRRYVNPKSLEDGRTRGSVNPRLDNSVEADSRNGRPLIPKDAA